MLSARGSRRSLSTSKRLPSLRCTRQKSARGLPAMNARGPEIAGDSGEIYGGCMGVLSQFSSPIPYCYVGSGHGPNEHRGASGGRRSIR